MRISFPFTEIATPVPRTCNSTKLERVVKVHKYWTSLCCDMGQNDTIGKIELNPSFVLSSDETNCKNDIQLFHQLFDELCVNRDYH